MQKKKKCFTVMMGSSVLCGGFFLFLDFMLSVRLVSGAKRGSRKGVTISDTVIAITGAGNHEDVKS
jgi:hypothetical protein